MSKFSIIEDQEKLEAMKKVDLIEHLESACEEINRLKAEIKSKEDLMENLLHSIHDKVLHKEDVKSPKILFDIKQDIFEIQNNVCDLSIEVSNSIKNSEGNSLESKAAFQNPVSSSSAFASALSAMPSSFASAPPFVPNAPGMAYSGQHFMIQQAMLDAYDKPNRVKNVIIIFRAGNVQLINQYIDSLIAFCTLNNLASIDPKRFEWYGPDGNILKIKTNSQEAAHKVTECAIALKKSNELYQSVTVHQDFTMSELQLYRELWREVIRRNNNAGFYEWTVKNFKIVKNSYMLPWSYNSRVQK